MYCNNASKDYKSSARVLGGLRTVQKDLMERPMIPWYEKARSLMRAKNMTIRELSDKLDRTPGGIGHYLSGRRDPKPGMLRQIARELNVSVSELIEDDPSFARDAVEHEVLELIRAMDETNKPAALAMLRGLSRDEDKPDD